MSRLSTKQILAIMAGLVVLLIVWGALGLSDKTAPDGPASDSTGSTSVTDHCEQLYQEYGNQFDTHDHYIAECKDSDQLLQQIHDNN